jgi:type I restriction enzyme M protein
MTADLQVVESRLWAAADQLWANTGLSPSAFSTPVLGLIFLRYADKRFTEAEAALDAKRIPADEREPMDYQAQGVLYLPQEARFSHLLTLTEGANLGKAIATAMTLVEEHNPELKGVLPRGYNLLPNATLVELLRLLAPAGLGGGRLRQGVRVLPRQLRPEGGPEGRRLLHAHQHRAADRRDPPALPRPHLRPRLRLGRHVRAVAAFVERHHKSATRELTVFGTEKASDTVKLAKMNLAVHGLSGDIREANTYYEDPHKALGRFDFVMANPPFNVSGVDKDRLKDDPRFPARPAWRGQRQLPVDPALLRPASTRTGRAGFVMANSAGDARGSELEIRKKLIQSGAVDVIVSVGSNFFYTVTLPCTLWFFDKAKARGPRKGPGAVPGCAAISSR